MKRVYVVGINNAITNMFTEEAGYTITDIPMSADILCFIGGADVNPALYGEDRIRGTNISLKDDERDHKKWEAFHQPDKLKIGICRGAQFLNVMNGGKLWQHVDNHACGHHKLIDVLTDQEFDVTSTHHQMMKPTDEGIVLGISNEASVKISHNQSESILKEPMSDDIEVVWYPKTRSLCFQPHPEMKMMTGYKTTKDYFFSLIQKLEKE